MNSRSPILTDPTLNATLSDAAMLTRAVNLIAPKSDWAVLDLGTGKGNTAIAVARFVRSVVALDYDEDVLEQCRQQVHAANLSDRITVQRGSAHELEFEDGRFDLVTCRAAFHHFPDPVGTLRHVLRVLKPEGVLYVMDAVFSDYARQIWTPVARIRERDLQSFYTYQEFIDMFRCTGLTIDRLVPSLFRRSLKEWTGNAPEAIRSRLRDVVLGLDERVLKELHFVETDGEWTYFYNIIEFVSTKTRLG
jgi:SAM-dependent methyltransferase